MAKPKGIVVIPFVSGINSTEKIEKAIKEAKEKGYVVIPFVSGINST